MEIHSILGARIYDDSAAVIFSTAEDPRLAGLNCQIKHTDILIVKETGPRGWRRMRPDEASTLQRTIFTLLSTSVGFTIGHVILGPTGGIVGGLVGLKTGLKFGGIGRQVPLVILCHEQNRVFLGALPLWQVTKLTALIEEEESVTTGEKIKFVEAEVS